jgi:cytochrome c oxidase subunit III
MREEDLEKNDWPKRREPFAFMLYLGLFGSCILFLSIFLIFIKKEVFNQQIPFVFPNSLWVSTFFIFSSSLSLYAAQLYFKTQHYKSLRFFLILTLLLGFAFLYAQFQVWKALMFTNQTLSNTTSASFIYILTGLHLVHILGGLVALFVTISRIFRKGTFVDTFIYTVNPPNQLNLKLLAIFWHFLALLWLIIVLFLWYHAA